MLLRLIEFSSGQNCEIFRKKMLFLSEIELTQYITPFFHGECNQLSECLLL